MTEECKEVISPEGVEERLLEEIKFELTMTQGGKFRFYYSTKGVRQPGGVFDTKEEAQQRFYESIMVMGAFFLNPKETIRRIRAEKP